MYSASYVNDILSMQNYNDDSNNKAIKIIHENDVLSFKYFEDKFFY